MQRDESDPPVSAYANDEAPPRASISTPISPALTPARTPTPTPAPTPQIAAPAAPRPVRDVSGRALALIALAVALTGMAYNTWRNETSEAQRNVRQACFMLLEESAALQQIVDLRFGGHDRSKSSWASAWGKATLIRDLGELAPSRTGQEAQHVYEIWSQRAHQIDERNPLAEDELSDAIERMRRQTLEDLRGLD
ncbi:MAG: hypothetical protein KA144_16415 [Xanthomonadaceae bacterium]|nr:hypothetical protein [Xanthomonadaceae bacterium]